MLIKYTLSYLLTEPGKGWLALRIVRPMQMTEFALSDAPDVMPGVAGAFVGKRGLDTLDDAADERRGGVSHLFQGNHQKIATRKWVSFVRYSPGCKIAL